MREVLVARIEDLRPGERKLVFVDGRSMVVFNIDGELHAIDNECPHQGASIASGKLEGRYLRCPAHGLRIDLVEGRTVAGGLCLRKCPIEVRSGWAVMKLEEPEAGGAGG
jgi:3-phenylpropionate/trans-cinnamate dioxygenase ferredoxin subunit